MLTTLLVPQHARNEPDHGVDHDHRGHFSAIEDKVADGNLIRLQDVDHPLIDALVPAAYEHQALVFG